MIYISFFKKKVTKIYLSIFLLLSIVFSSLFLARHCMIKKGNVAYENSYLYFNSSKNIDLSKEKNIKKYNKAIAIDCSNPLTNVFITKDTPILNDNYQNYIKCMIDNYTIEYTMERSNNIIEDKNLFNYLSNKQNEYYYFISLNNWFKMKNSYKELSNKYQVEINVQENRIDSVDYKNVIVLFNIFINIVISLFIILSIISILNIIVDEKKNNTLYYSLGYSKRKICQITMNKIILILLIPVCILILTFLFTALL